MLQFDQLPPAQQIATLMRRVYQHAMTTTSGGNLSIRDADGGIWISPSGIDKGTLQPADVICIRPDGTILGPHKPSIEYPFHQAIYETRPDLKAILHAHPADLVAFSIVRTIPDTRIVPQAQQICGAVGFAPYAMPGTEQLGQNIANQFHAGFDCVLLENHGVVCAASSLLAAYHRFETLDFCARLHIQARRLGQVRLLTDQQLNLFRQPRANLPEFTPSPRTASEQQLRQQIRDMVHRAYDQHIMTSTEGTLSARLDPSTFLITPTGIDRHYLDADDIVTIRDGQREAGRLPSRAAALHQTIYAQHPETSSIISAQPPHVMAFGVTDAAFNIRTIPESYVVLRDVPKIPFGVQCTDETRLSDMLTKDCPVLMIENDALLAVGSTLIQAFDRLEVAEFTARSLLRASTLGNVSPMSEAQISELRKTL